MPVREFLCKDYGTMEVLVWGSLLVQPTSQRTSTPRLVLCAMGGPDQISFLAHQRV